MKYELMLILDPKQTDKEIEKILKEVKGIFTENAYTLIDEDLWGKRALAYKIKGHTHGYYAVMLFQGEPAGMNQVKKDLRIQAGIVRQMITKMEDDYLLLRFENTVKSSLNKHAEELSKKVRSTKRETAPKKEENAEEEAQLEEKLKAIVNDADIDL